VIAIRGSAVVHEFDFSRSFRMRASGSRRNGRRSIPCLAAIYTTAGRRTRPDSRHLPWPTVVGRLSISEGRTDPFNKLIDRNADDDMIDVTKE